MPKEVLQALEPARGGVYVDCTIGLGGHSELILESSSGVSLIGIDRDEEALKRAKARLAKYSDRVTLVKADYKELATVLAGVGIKAVEGILADFGVSSMQLEAPERGFSFQNDGPLDMRMDLSSSTTARDLVNTLSERELADIIYEYGEERASFRIARRICEARAHKPISTTLELARIVERALGGRSQKIHPATRTFQALRIAVNRELEGLEGFITDAVTALKPGGRLAVITFHSLEDRIVKVTLRYLAGECQCPRNLPACCCGAVARVRLLGRKAITATASEIGVNPRSRSAKLRRCEKL